MRIPSSSSWLLQVGFQSLPGGEWVPYAFPNPPAFAVSFRGEKKLQFLLRFGRIRKRWAATAGHKTILEGGTALLLFLIRFPKAPWTTSRSSRVENHEEDNQVFVSSSSLFLLLRLLSQDELRPTLLLPRCLVLHPRRLHTFPLLVMPRPPPPSWLEKFIDRQKAERRVEGEETNGVRRFSEASGRRRTHQVFLAEYVLPRVRVVGLLFCFVCFFLCLGWQESGCNLLLLLR